MVKTQLSFSCKDHYFNLALNGLGKLSRFAILDSTIQLYKQMAVVTGFCPKDKAKFFNFRRNSSCMTSALNFCGLFRLSEYVSLKKNIPYSFHGFWSVAP